MRDIYFSRIGLPILLQGKKYVDRSGEYTNRSQTHEYGNWDWGRAISRKGIHKWDFLCSAMASELPELSKGPISCRFPASYTAVVTTVCVLFKRGIFFFFFFIYVIQHCFIFRSSDSTVSEDAGIEPRTVATLALTVRRSTPLLDLIHADIIYKKSSYYLTDVTCGVLPEELPIRGK